MTVYIDKILKDEHRTRAVQYDWACGRGGVGVSLVFGGAGRVRAVSDSAQSKPSPPLWCPGWQVGGTGHRCPARRGRAGGYRTSFRPGDDRALIAVTQGRPRGWASIGVRQSVGNYSL